jgi:hypothetical protein|tara:strand:- start:75 stop:410 length:336 start_codon:yes stop_codon:yes gene_type:complete
MNNAQTLILNVRIEGQNDNGDTLVKFLNNESLPVLTITQSLKLELGEPTMYTRLRVAESGRVVYTAKDRGENIAKAIAVFEKTEHVGCSKANEIAIIVNEAIVNQIGYMEY